MSNIFDITGRVIPTTQVKPAVNQDLVILLKDLLAKAERAELLALFTVGYEVKPTCTDLEFVMDGNTGPVHPQMMLGAIADGLARFTRQVPGLLNPTAK